MPKQPQSTEDQIAHAREGGASFWDIKLKFGVPAVRVREIIRAHAPHVLHNTVAVKVSWDAVLLFKRGMSYGKIAKAIGVSKATAIRAVDIGLKSWDRRGMDIKRL